jgi:ubiquinone/menaquinone biosynthesis C-methylase UbiE
MKNILFCPNCRLGKVIVEYKILCNNCNTEFDYSYNGLPILICDNELFNKKNYLAEPHTKSRYKSKLVKYLNPSINFSFRKQMEFVKKKLIKIDSTILILGAGDTITFFKNFFSDSNVIATDIDVHSNVHFFSDIHNIPLSNNSIDFVICTAVLEHVLYPNIAVDEIFRVLKDDGIVYSEIPFLQSVHEGAFDFTRYTMVGHINLFRNFEILAHGPVAGIFTSLFWLLEYIFVPNTKYKTIENIFKAIARLLFGWIKYLDYLFYSKSFDSASCTFVLGRRRTFSYSDREIIQFYSGSRHISHV